MTQVLKMKEQHTNLASPKAVNGLLSALKVCERKERNTSFTEFGFKHTPDVSQLLFQKVRSGYRRLVQAGRSREALRWYKLHAHTLRDMARAAATVAEKHELYIQVRHTRDQACTVVFFENVA